jgi:hypothetical protein
MHNIQFEVGKGIDLGRCPRKLFAQGDLWYTEVSLTPICLSNALFWLFEQAKLILNIGF